jgi:hypothetical protein
MIPNTPEYQRTARLARRSIRVLLAIFVTGAALVFHPAPVSGVEPVITAAPAPVQVQQPAEKQGIPTQLVLDDGTWESTVTFPGQQFLWFNQFDLDRFAFELEEVSVLFPSGAFLSVGDAVQIAVWHDPDDDPANGADLITTIDTTIQSVDGTTFSVYPLATPPVTPFGGNLLVGVINRYVVGGIPAATSPAAIDITASQGRSWYATWTTDPPNPPTLPSDDQTALIDGFLPGNWMIRANGQLIGRSIPSQTPTGIALLIAAIALGGALLLGRRG